MSYLFLKKQDPHQPFYPNNFYHVYNRGNNGDMIFYKRENYIFFLKKFDFYLSEYLDVYAYCLIPNHFHFLICVKDKDDVTKIIAEQFRRLFLSYSKSINLQEERTGSLFQKHFKRKLIEDEKYLIQVIYYIHSNPQQHNIVDNFKDYPYSSYHSLISNKHTKLKKVEIINWFNNKENFIKYHKEIHRSIIEEEFVIEDEQC